MSCPPQTNIPHSLDMTTAHLREVMRWLNHHLSRSVPASEEDIRKLRYQLNDTEVLFDKLAAHALTIKYQNDPAAMAWKETMDHGNLDVAVRQAREIHDLRLREALDLVKAYRDKMHAFAK
jgi:hypothetical protein